MPTKPAECQHQGDGRYCFKCGEAYQPQIAPAEACDDEAHRHMCYDLDHTYCSACGLNLQDESAYEDDLVEECEEE